MKNKLFGFKSILFLFVTITVAFYVWACSENSELISLQGVILAWLAIAGGIIGVREATKMKKMGLEDKK